MAKSEDKAKNKENKVKKNFFKDFKVELKRVNWPTPKQLVNNTIAVITIVLILTAIVFVLDSVFETMNKYVITELQSQVIERYSEDETSETEANVEDSSEQNETTENNTEENTTTEQKEETNTQASEE